MRSSSRVPAPPSSARARACHGAARVGLGARDLERERGAEHERVAVRRPVAARERFAQPRALSAHRRRASPRASSGAIAEIARVADRALDLAGAHVVADERARRRRLVPARLAVHDARQRRASSASPASVSAMRRGHRVAERADHVERRRRGIRERPQDVEHGAHAERLAHGRDVLHRGVIVRREQEREAAVAQAGAGGRLVERDR